MKVIYIFEFRHGYDGDEKFFQFSVLKRADIEFEIWSMVNWHFPQIPIPKNMMLESFYYHINNEIELKMNLERVRKENCYFICYPYEQSYDFISYKIRYNIKKAGFAFSNLSMYIGVGDLPKYMAKSKNGAFLDILYFVRFLLHPFFSIFKELIAFRRKKNIIEVIKDELTKAWGSLLIKADYNFVPSNMTLYCVPNIWDKYSKRTKLLHAESYDDYLRAKPKKRIMQEEYIVFIDDYFWAHSDFVKCNDAFPVENKKEFFIILENFFSSLENKYKCKIIIAGHPKGEYELGDFCGRKIICNNTAVLIRDAVFVINTISNCINLILLYKKDFLTIFDEQFFRSRFMKDAYSVFVSFFGRDMKLLNIRDVDAIENIDRYFFKYQPWFYEYYINMFIGSENTRKEKLLFEDIYEFLGEKKLISF